MKIMGQNQINSFLPQHFPKPDTRSSEDTPHSPAPSPNKSSTKPENKQVNGAKAEEDDDEGEDDKKKLVVCIEINSVKYQGILFAQQPHIQSSS